LNFFFNYDEKNAICLSLSDSINCTISVIAIINMILNENMENLNPESLLRKAQALGDDIKEMEAINVARAYNRAQMKIKSAKRKQVYHQLMRYAAFLTLPLLLTSLVYIFMNRNKMTDMPKLRQLQVLLFVSSFPIIQLFG